MLTTILASAMVRGEQGYAQTITMRGHVLASDEPVKRGGTDTGATPVELLLASLGACTAITFRMYDERKQWNVGAITIKLRLVKEGEQQRIERAISVSGALDAVQRERLLEIADRTPVTRMVAPGVR